MADEPVEQEPARLAGRRIDVAVRLPAVGAVDHAEFGDVLRQRFFGGGPGLEVEAPAVQPRLHAVQCQEPERPLPLGAGAVIRGFGVALVEPVEHNLVAVLVGVGEVQHEGRVGFEPLDVGRTAAARQYRESRGHIGMKPCYM